MTLFQILVLNGLGKTAVLSVRANTILEASACALLNTLDKPAVVVSILTETPCDPRPV